MARIPHSGVDHTLALLRDPYRFIATTCRRLGTDLFETRLLLRKTICLTGPDAAELFYDRRHFERRGAAPEPLRATLFGTGGVQGLDDESHRRRKAMFLSLVSVDRVRELAATASVEWQAAAEHWAGQQRPVALYEAVQEIFTRAVCRWAGVPLEEADVDRRRRDLVALFDAAASASPRHLQSRLARRRSERWLESLIDEIRAGRREPSHESASDVIAYHEDADGSRLKSRAAAVELLNVLRPTIAVAVYVVFVAHALHAQPDGRERLRDGDAAEAERFVQEVRRFYPFFPAVVAQVRESFEWQGFHFPKGVRAVLDLYGTNHDLRTWEAPDEFRPDRFRDRIPGLFEFVPQGGGNREETHRCPGEDIAKELMKGAIDVLTRRISYEVPAQDLQIDFSRLPALPRDRFVIANVRLQPEASA